LRAFGMGLKIYLTTGAGCTACEEFQSFSSSVSPHMPLMTIIVGGAVVAACGGKKTQKDYKARSVMCLLRIPEFRRGKLLFQHIVLNPAPHLTRIEYPWRLNRWKSTIWSGEC
jgi:hypothetical protein